MLICNFIKKEKFAKNKLKINFKFMFRICFKIGYVAYNQQKLIILTSIFQQRPKDHESERNKAIEALNQGVGRVIPVKQGLLYKKSSKSALNRSVSEIFKKKSVIS